jgi:hypothetical protein
MKAQGAPRRFDVAHSIRIGLIAAILFPCLATSTHAGEQPDAAIAEVLGKAITERDLSPPQSLLEYWATLPPAEAADEKREHRNSAVSGAIISALADRYIKKNALEPTEDDIQSFLNSPMGHGEELTKKELEAQVDDLRKRFADPALKADEHGPLARELKQAEELLEELKKPERSGEAERKELKEQIPVLEERLRSPDLTDEDRREIKEELEYNRRFADLTDEQAAKEFAEFESEMQHEIALGWARNWKFHSALFKKYGGRIIWQQAGIEPIDAMRMWLEEQEKAGDFVIHDPQLHASFWQYYRRDHPFTTDKPKGDEFDIPWWNKPPDQPRR